ncbi:MAG: exodeoxyribonuclease VII small subunit [Micavibrio sp.]
MAKAQAALESLSFETALSELETIVRDLEAGKTSLEESIDAYERGVALRNHCEQKLRDAQAKIEKITVNTDGSISVKPFENQE